MAVLEGFFEVEFLFDRRAARRLQERFVAEFRFHQSVCQEVRRFPAYQRGQFNKRQLSSGLKVTAGKGRFLEFPDRVAQNIEEFWGRKILDSGLLNFVVAECD